MFRALALSSLLLAVAILPRFTFACDVDLDGIDDPTAYEQQPDGSWTWRSILSSDSSTMTVADFGASTSYPAPGRYFGSGTPEVYGHVDSQFFWTVRIPGGGIDMLNFGRIDVSYMASRDFDGNGVADLAKFLNRCNKLKLGCKRKRVRGNFLINESTGTDSFVDPVTDTGLFGRGLSAIFSMDANADGSDDICYTSSLRKKPKNFKVICKDVLTRSKVYSTRIGRLFNTPLSLKRAGSSDYIVLWKERKKTAETKITIIDPSGNKTNFTMPAVGKVIVGDWLGTGSQQVGVAVGGVLNIYEPIGAAFSSMLIPAGTPIDCDNNFNGPGEAVIMTSRNACRVENCNS